ncbi:MAG: RND family efflux transporter MFP subunit [Roseivirga sp.]|jgi:RND family efflux transporter MFP subunit
MKKVIYIISAISLFVACNQKPSLESLRGDLSVAKEEMKALQTSIDSLEKNITLLDTNKMAEPAKLVPVKIQALVSENFEHFVKVSGLVGSKQNVLLSAEGNGRVISIDVKEGDPVRAGQVIIRLESDIVTNQLSEAKLGYQLAKTTFERRARLWKENIGSEIEYLNAETNFLSSKDRLAQVEAQLKNTMIIAPVSGVVDNINVNTGEFVGVGTPVVRIIDLNNLEVETDLSENYLKAVKKGDPVKVSIPALGLNQEEKIIFLSQYIKPENRSFTVKVALNNQSELIKPNLLAELTFRDYNNAEAFVIPSISVKKDLKGNYVYTVVNTDGENRVNKRYIITGYSFSDKSEITSGLIAGEKVIIAGFNEVSEGQKVSVQ